MYSFGRNDENVTEPPRKSVVDEIARSVTEQETIVDTDTVRTLERLHPSHNKWCPRGETRGPEHYIVYELLSSVVLV